MTVDGDLLLRAEQWAASMRSRGEDVVGPRRIAVRGRYVLAIRSITDAEGNVTAFRAPGCVVCYPWYQLGVMSAREWSEASRSGAHRDAESPETPAAPGGEAGDDQ